MTSRYVTVEDEFHQASPHFGVMGNKPGVESEPRVACHTGVMAHGKTSVTPSLFGSTRM